MNPTVKRWIRRAVVTFVILIGAAVTGFIGLWYYATPEHIGLRLVGIIKAQGAPGEDTLDLWVRFREEWSRSAGKSSREVYRFVYTPSFHNNDICVSAWKDGERYWIRTGVLDGYGSLYAGPLRFLLWERTRALPAEQWKQIQAMFAKRSVIDPLNGEEGKRGFDGADWTVETVIDGQAKRTTIWSPLDNANQAQAGMQDFVEAGRRMLKYGRVTVREMY